MDDMDDMDVAIAIGYPGTGKTFLAFHSALAKLADKDKNVDKIIILRSSVSSRDIGFQPGNTNDKMKEYEAPYIKICTDLYGRGDAYSILKQKGNIEFMPTSFLRGMTFDNCVVILDEFQNCSYQELKTVVTRFGDNCRMILIGDTGQDDLTSKRYNEESGISKFMNIMSGITKLVGITKMDIDDIVRSGFVKDFIISEEKSKEKS